MEEKNKHIVKSKYALRKIIAESVKGQTINMELKTVSKRQLA